MTPPFRGQQARLNRALTSPSASQEHPTWRQRLEALRNLWPLLVMVWQTHRGYVTAIVALRFAKGYEQMLGRRFEEGVELSGGEWQKVRRGEPTRNCSPSRHPATAS